MFDEKTQRRQRWIATVWLVAFSIMAGGGIYHKVTSAQTTVIAAGR